MADNESLERALTLEPTKRKRSSILKQPDKRTRDSRTVSFNDKYYYKELYQDGTFFLGEDMDITTMDIIDPANQTIDKSADMSMDQTMVTQSVHMVTHNNDMLQNSQIMTSQSVHMVTHNNDISQDLSQNSQIMEISTLHASPTSKQAKGSPTPLKATSSINSSQTAKGSPSMDISTLHASPTTEQPKGSPTSQLAKDSPNSSQLAEDSPITQLTQVSPISQLAQFSQISEISSLDDTLFGAFHDSNNLSMLSSNRTSGLDTLMHNIDALNECIQKVDHESDECRRKLDAEIQDLFRFYRHIVNKNDEYEFAIAIFGLRHSLWLIIKIDPETYPNEKLKLRFAVKKQDTHLYPFKEYAEAVRRYTKEGSYGYLARFVINAQRFRRFLRKIGYKKPNP